MARLLSVISCALLLSLLLAKSGSGQQIQNQLPNTSTRGQPDSATLGSSGTVRPQPADDRTLEISPQPGGQPPTDNESVAARAFKPSEDEASLDRNFEPEPEQPTKGQAPYLGISVAETDKCFLGHEEHGLEVLSVSTGSPADKAGLNGTGGFSVPHSIVAAIFIPVGLAAHALLHRAGMPGYSGDLIIGVNDHRVRDKAELDQELTKLKPGDSLYLNIVRPLPSGAHQTLRAVIRVGYWRTEAPLKSAGHAIGPASFDSHGNLSYAY